MAAHAKIKAGDVIGRITVVSLAGMDERHRKYWFVRCACGREYNTRSDSLLSGRVHSCGKRGCFRAEVSALKRTRHGQSRTPEYSVWCGMLYRCENPKAPNYKRYGGRGIAVCERWHSIAAFVEDMGPRPSLQHSIDRVDNDKGYEPGNCVWALPAQQAANTSKTVKVVLSGAVLSLNEAWKRLGLRSAQPLYGRIKREGETPQEAVDHFAHRVAA